MAYNCYVGDIEMLVATHLDVARREDASGSKLKIKVCTHYTNEQGHIVLYQPGLEYQEGIIAHFIELDSWHGEEVRNAKTYDLYSLQLALKEKIRYLFQKMAKLMPVSYCLRELYLIQNNT